MMLWLNGALLPAAAACLSPADRGFLLGDGVFETIRVEAGEPRHLMRHLARLRSGAALLGIPMRTDDAEVAAGVAAVLGGSQRAAVRITLSRGPGARGVLPPADPVPTLLITATPLSVATSPARLIVVTATRRNELSPLSRIKSLNYLDNVLARQEAAAAGADDGLLLNTQDCLADTSSASLFIILKTGDLVTSRVLDGALPGLWRARVLETTMARERRLSIADLDQARAAVLGNSLGVRPVGWIGLRALEPVNSDAWAVLVGSLG